MKQTNLAQNFQSMKPKKKKKKNNMNNLTDIQRTCSIKDKL